MNHLQRRRAYYRQRQGAHRQPQPRTFNKTRFIIALGMALFAIVSYYNSGKVNEITGEKQYIGLTEHQEIALGLQATPQIISQYGGLHTNEKAQAFVDQIGHKIVRNSNASQTQWEFDFHLLSDNQVVNAFALPGGQVFITEALFSKLKTQGQLAGVLGHEIAHVIARHGAQRMAKQNLTQGLIGSVVMGTGSQNSGQLAQMIGNLVNMQYGREDELESDYLGVQFMTDAGYHPHALKGVMKILAESAGGKQQAEFFSTHPNPENRIEKIEYAINHLYPDGLPEGLIQ